MRVANEDRETVSVELGSSPTAHMSNTDNIDKDLTAKSLAYLQLLLHFTAQALDLITCYEKKWGVRLLSHQQHLIPKEMRPCRRQRSHPRTHGEKG